MSQKVGRNNNKVYKVVLTGGPCGGKTTGQARLCTFFENLGWKVYRVPETATVLMGGGVKWTDMSDEQVFQFQFNLIRTMMQIETTFFELAASSSSNCLVICDRGIMDATAYLKPGQWEKMRTAESWETTDLRDIRYNQVIHMVSAARGAEEFYGTDDHVTRYEGVVLARELDERASQAWVGHPYFDVIDNSTDFEHKVIRMIAAVCNRLGIDVSDRLHMDSRKRKFLVQTLPEENGAYMNGDLPAVCKKFPQFQDFIVIHDYLVTPESRMQARIRRRGQNVKWDSLKGKWDLDSDESRDMRYQICRVMMEDEIYSRKFLYGTDQDFCNWTYTHTIRRPEINKVSVETKMQISAKEYELLLAQRDKQHYSIYKKRRCFLWNNQYFQMDIYQQPCHPRCKGLVLLETYTTKEDDELKLPDFLDIVKEVTTDRTFSMYNLSMKDERERTDSACEREVEPITNGTVY